jgi:hypothetical protein
VARAGNAWDRALLLQALLAAQGHQAQLATGSLDADTAAAVVVRALEGPSEPLADPPAEDILGLDRAAISTRAGRDNALVAEGLGDALSTHGTVPEADLAEAVTEHAWVRLASEDGTAMELDPTFPDAIAGTTLAAVVDTFDEPPVALRHALHVSVVAETLADGVLSEQRLLDVSLDAADAADDETWLTFQAEAGGIGGALLDALGDVSWLPILSVNGEDIQGHAVAVGSSGDVGDFFGGSDGAPELTGLRIDLSSEAPGTEAVRSQRVLLDRVPPADRASGDIAAERLTPMPPAGEPLPALAEIHQVLVSNGAADLRAHAVNRAIALGYGATLQNEAGQADDLKIFDLLYPLAVANQTIVLASERLLTPDIGVEGEARAFVGRPRGYLVTFAPLPGVPDGSSIATDLALDDVDVVTLPDAADDLAARVRIWHGVLSQALETELSLARAAAVSPDTLDVWSVSLEMEGVLELLRPEDIEQLPAERVALRQALAEGALALEVPGSPRGAFWSIDPGSGRTRSIGEPGLRVGFIGGGNYVNSSGGGPRYVIDPKTGNTLGTIRDGRFTPARRPPASRCSGGTEYVVILGCVSIPAGMTVGMVYGVIVTAIVSWATAILQLL